MPHTIVIRHSEFIAQSVQFYSPERHDSFEQNLNEASESLVRRVASSEHNLNGIWIAFELQHQANDARW